VAAVAAATRARLLGVSGRLCMSARMCVCVTLVVAAVAAATRARLLDVCANSVCVRGFGPRSSSEETFYFLS